MADLIQRTDTLNDGREKLNTAIELLDGFQGQLDTIVVEGDSSVEAAQARIDPEGKTYATLKKRLDAEHTTVTSQLADTAKKTEVREETTTNPIKMSELHTEVKAAMTGGAVAVVGENAVGRENVKEKAVSPVKTSFFNRTKNLYHGELTKGFVYASNDRGGQFSTDTETARVCIIKIEPNTTYTVTTFEGGDRLRLYTFKNFPVHLDYPSEMIYSTINPALLVRTVTFTSSSESNYLVVFLSNLGKEVKCQVEVDDKFTEYVEPYVITGEKIGVLKENNLPNFSGDKILERTIGESKVSFLTKGTKNLYHGDLIDGFVYGIESNPERNGTFGAPSSNGEKTCIVKVTPGKTYTITSYGGDRRRYAVYEKFPKYNDKAVELLFAERSGGSSSGTSFTFTAPENAYHLAVYLSSTGKFVKCQVEIGEEPTEYAYPYILRENIGVGNNGESPRVSHSIRDKYRIVERFPLDYKPLPQLPANEDGEFNTNTAKHTDIYGLYDDLMSKHPNYITREVLGLDDFGNEIRVYKLTPPEMISDYGNFASNRLKMIWTSGVHGDERTYPYSVFKIVEEICERKGEHILLDYLRTSVNLIIVPVVTPSAYDDDTRRKRNGVNINRNFDNDWVRTGESGSSPFSEPESRAVRKVVEENSDAEILLDFHNYFTNNTHVFWAFFETNFPNKAKERFYSNYLFTITDKLSSEYDWFTYGKVPVWMSHGSRPSVEGHAEMNGMFSHTVEIRDFIPQKPNGKKLDEANVEFAMMYAVNMVAGIINAM